MIFYYSLKLILYPFYRCYDWFIRVVKAISLSVISLVLMSHRESLQMTILVQMIASYV